MTEIFNKVVRPFTLYWLTGPIFNKELRVASRRKRFYFLRSFYLILLMVMMAMVWVAVTYTLNSVVYNISRMAEASKIIVTSVAWFQFIGAQLVAIVICSTAINSEIYNRTLYVLMTTPITSFQIIMGKLSSRLWQIFILLGISFPLLAIVRVFGGIPWLYLIKALCLTLSTVFFISAVSLFYSILFRRAYVVVIFTVITLAIIFILFPFTIYLGGEALDSVSFWGGMFKIEFDNIAEEIVHVTNPYVMMAMTTDDLFNASSGQFSIKWLVQSGMLLLLALGILFISCIFVRKMSLKNLVPKKTRKSYKMPPLKSKTYWLRRPFFLHSMIQRTIGTGMIWKEFLHPVLGKFRKVVFIALILMVGAFVISVFLVLLFESIDLFGIVLAGTVFGIITLAILFTIIIPATYITAEKESGTWLILLTTCYSDTQILSGKIIGILRRIIIVWLPFLLIYYMVAYVAGNPVSMFFTLILVLSIAIGFVITSGLYFSSRFKHSTTAVICNLSLVAILWAAIPGILLMLEELSYRTLRPIERLIHIDIHDLNELYWVLTPPGLVLDIIENTFDPRRYHILSLPTLLIVYATLHLLAIIVCLWRTKANLRKRIF